MDQEEEKPATRVFSVRLPLDEAEVLDEEARKAGLNRNDYLYSLLRSKKTFVDAEGLRDAIEAFRQIERVFDRYLTVLEGLLIQCHKGGSPQLFARVREEIDRAGAMVDLSLKAQMQAARILTNIRRRASRD